MRSRRDLLRVGASTAFASLLGFVPRQTWASRRFLDMSDRPVTVPDRVARIATLGPVPVINSFVFAFRDGGLIVNGLPTNFARSARWKYQSVFAPGLQSRPIIQAAGNDPILDAVLEAAPDVVLTMTAGAIHALEAAGVPVVYLAWDRPEEVKDLMALLGRLLDKPNVATAYGRYFDTAVDRIATLLKGLPDKARPRVLYCDLVQLTQPHLIAEWWIRVAGGHSVTDNGRSVQSVSFSLEQVLAWDPEVLIVPDARQIKTAYADARLKAVTAIRNHRVHVAPSGAHLWTNRTVEEPLTVLWAATILHPERTRALDLKRETFDFYDRFFGTRLQPAQIDEILAGVGAE